MKICTKCRQAKSKSQFYAHKTCKDGLRPECKECHRRASKARYKQNPGPFRRRSEKQRKANPTKAARVNRDWRLKKYGLTEPSFQKMIRSCRGRCQCCGTQFGTSKGSRPHIDHDHTTGKVRGLLCMLCNTGLGAFGDSKSRLRKAINYLDKTCSRM